MHEPVVAASGSVGDVVSLNEQDFEASQRAIARHTGTGDATTDDNYIFTLCRNKGSFFKSVIKQTLCC